MLRNRSRAVTGKQALMADHTPQSPNSSPSFKKPLPNSLFNSPRFRAPQIQFDHSLISPTSVLDSNPFLSLQNPFSREKKPILSGNKQKMSEPIGLALIEESGDSKPSKSVIFGAKLRVQIPTFTPNFCGLMTVQEMEDCEEYTCVRKHGEDGKVTHIFDNCVVKMKGFAESGSRKLPENPTVTGATKNYKNNKNNKNTKSGFLSFCYTCKKHLQQSNDIYIYRGEKAFCSHECRYQEILLDEEDDSS